MDRSNLFIRTVAVCSSLLLTAGFVLYYAGIFDRFFSSDITFLTELRTAETFDSLIPAPLHPDTPGIAQLSGEDLINLRRETIREMYRTVYGEWSDEYMFLAWNHRPSTDTVPIPPPPLDEKELYLMAGSKSIVMLPTPLIVHLKRMLFADLHTDMIMGNDRE